MPFSAYAAMLSSQLIVTVAGRVPEFDVGPSCRESTVSDLPQHGEICSGHTHQRLAELNGARQGDVQHGRKISGPPTYIG